MPDLTTQYLGLTLPNPVIAGSSGLTQNLDGVRRCADAGAGAIVLKSIFEEEIQGEVDRLVASTGDVTYRLEAEEYLNRFGREDAMAGYLQLIRDAKKAIQVPVVASVNCTTAGGWIDYARHVAEAGADALELNVFLLPADIGRDGVSYERVYFEIAEQVTQAVSIPVALKIGPYFSSLARTLDRLSRTGIKGLVLFNRFYRIDFDIEAMTLTSGSRLSTPGEMEVPLRWISILSGRVGCDLAATTGVHDGQGVVKQLLAGAAAVQVCSALYRDGEGAIGKMVNELSAWMDRHRFTELPQFKGRLRQRGREDPAAYERVQFAREMGEAV
jgi:dihydroorotate dehydrogenase (fumarate)